jgi:hypothetical protein
MLSKLTILQTIKIIYEKISCSTSNVPLLSCGKTKIA